MLHPETWVEKYSDYLYNYAYARLSDEESAKDMVQEVFFAALKAKNSFRGESNEQTFLTAILKRKIIDFYRSKGKPSDHLLLDNLPFNDMGMHQGQWKDDRGPASWDKTVLEEIENEELADALKLCMTRLPLQWQACFIMKTVDSESTETVCKELDLSSSNLWVILHRARLKLRECLENIWFKQ
ncbi:MAG TPA: sigma-70 family RNA polymerase sigma factor [Salinivirga sp.]|uniref:sigma-70 family RNA polymerase sigma factor n=1 Tax=Salinivirga sp. TaxID=1970192 RepID=UPI002B46BB3E|nr:sigma-70 family RNA polymerase sigma factor [Salinivirga sp.]HKK58681.1 sigma-70 family RNA polymerase sigma factor [Salinivirga sp.]